MLPERLKLNREIIKATSDELSIPEEKIPLLVERMLRNEKSREMLFKALGDFVGRRAFLGAAAGFGVAAFGMGAAKADTYIRGEASDFYAPTAMPFSTIVYIDGSKVYAKDWRGKEIAKGTAGVDDEAGIQSAVDNLPEYGVLKLKGDFTITSGILASKNLIIDAYEASFKPGATRTAARMIQPDSGKKLIIYGLRMDLINGNYAWGVATGAEITRTGATLILIDCEINNINNYGISQTGDDGYLKLTRCKLTAQTSDSSSECLLAEDQKRVILEDVEIYGNKPYYIAAEEIRIDKFVIDASQNTTQTWCPTSGKYVSIKNGRFDSTYPRFYPYGDVHLNTLYSDAEIIEIENVRLLETAAAARLDFRGHSDGTTTYGFQKITIKDVFQEYTPISIVPFGSYQSFVKQLHIENVKFATYSASPFPLYVEDHNIEKAVLKDIYLPESSAVNCSYLGLKAGLANITTNIDLKRIYSKVTLSYLANLYDDGSSGFSISGTLDMRELQLLTVRLVTATVVNNLTIKQVNSGTATITAGKLQSQSAMA